MNAMVETLSVRTSKTIMRSHYKIDDRPIKACGRWVSYLNPTYAISDRTQPFKQTGRTIALSSRSSPFKPGTVGFRITAIPLERCANAPLPIPLSNRSDRTEVWDGTFHDGSWVGDGDWGKERTLQELLYNNAETYANVGLPYGKQATCLNPTYGKRSRYKMAIAL
jgi:hypothetical protein